MWKNQAMNLGIILHSRLSFNAHIQKKTLNIQAILNPLLRGRFTEHTPQISNWRPTKFRKTNFTYGMQMQNIERAQITGQQTRHYYFIRHLHNAVDIPTLWKFVKITRGFSVICCRGAFLTNIEATTINIEASTTSVEVTTTK